MGHRESDKRVIAYAGYAHSAGRPVLRKCFIKARRVSDFVLDISEEQIITRNRRYVAMRNPARDFRSALHFSTNVTPLVAHLPTASGNNVPGVLHLRFSAYQHLNSLNERDRFVSKRDHLMLTPAYSSGSPHAVTSLASHILTMELYRDAAPLPVEKEMLTPSLLIEATSRP